MKLRPPSKSFLKENFRIIFLLLIILAVSFYEVFFLGKTFKVTNTVSQALSSGVYGQQNNHLNFIPTTGVDSAVLEEPIFEFIRKSLRQGILPLWNPHQACGYPLISLMYAGIFYPLNFIIYIFPSFCSWDILILMRFLLAGFFTYWFMRTLRFTPMPSVCAAICFMLSGPMVVIQNCTVNVIVLTPLLLIVLEKLIQKPVAGRLVLVAAVVAMTFFAGHPENVFFVNVYGFLFFLFRLYSLRKTSPWKKVSGSLALAYGLALGLAAVTLFPFIGDFTGRWHNHQPGVGFLAEQDQERIVSVALPHFFQKVVLTNDWVLAGWSGGYLGVIPLALAFLGLFSNQKKGLNYFFAAIAFILFGKTYGWPIVNWIGAFPIFSMCRFSLHTVHLIALSIAICAGAGCRAITIGPKSFLKGLIFCALFVAIIFWNTWGHFSLFDLKLAHQAIIFAGCLLALWLIVLWMKDKKFLKKRYVGFLIVSLLFFELFCYINHERSSRFDSFPKSPYIEFLKSQPEKFRVYGLEHEFFPNTATGYGIDDIGIFEGLLGKKYVNFINECIFKDWFVPDLRPSSFRNACPNQRKEFLDLMNLKYFIFLPFPQMERLVTPAYTINSSGVTQDRARLIYSQEVNIYERAQPFPRAFVVHRVIFDEQQEASLASLESIVDRLRSTIVVHHAMVPEINSQLRHAPSQDTSNVQIVRYTPNEVVINAHLVYPGFLVLSDAYHPDWKAYVNGKEVKIYEADYLFRAVFLPAGQHLVKFIFVPVSFTIGFMVSVLTVIGMIFLF